MIQLEGDCLKVIRLLQVASPTLIRLGPLWTSVFPFPLHLLLFRLCMFLGPAIHLRICLLSPSLLHVMKARTFLHVALKKKKKKLRWLSFGCSLWFTRCSLASNNPEIHVSLPLNPYVYNLHQLD